MAACRVNRTHLRVLVCLGALITWALPGEADGFALKSTAFAAGGMIPGLYTCQGRDISPPLSWTGAPSGTRSFALICDDPDAPMGTWVHWVYFNIPASVSSLPQAVPKTQKPSPGGVHGRSSFKDLGYGGPCPPWGTHRYFFRLYALDVLLDLKPEVEKGEVLKAMEGHVLGTAELMGTFRKQ